MTGIGELFSIWAHCHRKPRFYGGIINQLSRKHGVKTEGYFSLRQKKCGYDIGKNTRSDPLYP